MRLLEIKEDQAELELERKQKAGPAAAQTAQTPQSDIWTLYQTMCKQVEAETADELENEEEVDRDETDLD